MAMINNENVSVNNVVYDITQGYGTVVDTTFNDITVRFNNGIRITYDKNGYYGGIRRLYWHNPIVIEPTKDNKLWDTLVGCLKEIHTFLSSKSK